MYICVHILHNIEEMVGQKKMGEQLMLLTKKIVTGVIWGMRAIGLPALTHTHTHTHIYIYIYIYDWSLYLYLFLAISI
jgi:hypothetical protein